MKKQRSKEWDITLIYKKRSKYVGGFYISATKRRYSLMRCPECSGKMERFTKTFLEIGPKPVYITRPYGTCTECRYTCSVDFVSGFWGGYRKAIGNLSKFGMKMLERWDVQLGSDEDAIPPMTEKDNPERKAVLEECASLIDQIKKPVKKGKK